MSLAVVRAPMHTMSHTHFLHPRTHARAIDRGSFFFLIHRFHSIRLCPHITLAPSRIILILGLCLFIWLCGCLQEYAFLMRHFDQKDGQLTCDGFLAAYKYIVDSRGSNEDQVSVRVPRCLSKQCSLLRSRKLSLCVVHFASLESVVLMIIFLVGASCCVFLPPCGFFRCIALAVVRSGRT